MQQMTVHLMQTFAPIEIIYNLMEMKKTMFVLMQEPTGKQFYQNKIIPEMKKIYYNKKREQKTNVLNKTRSLGEK